MAKSQEFKDELGTRSNPRIFRKGYLFKEIGEDSSGVISSFHDISTMQLALQTDSAGANSDFVMNESTTNPFAIFCDPDPSDWKHAYGIEGHETNTVLPDDTAFGDEAWTRSTPAGSAGTAQLIRDGAVAACGVLEMTCTSAQTIAFTKSAVASIVDPASTTPGFFTVEWKIKKASTTTEGANNNPFIIKIKYGKQQYSFTHNRNDITLDTLNGTSSANYPLVIERKLSQTLITNESIGQYTTVRVVFIASPANIGSTVRGPYVFVDQELVSKQRVPTSDDQGATADNEISFGYFAVPTVTSKTHLQYIRYIDAPLFPMETTRETFLPQDTLGTTSHAPNDELVKSGTGSTDTTVAPTSTDTGAFSSDLDKLMFKIEKSTAGAFTMSGGQVQTNALGNAIEFKAAVQGASSTLGRLEFKFRDGSRECKLELYGIGNTTLNDGIKFNGTTVGGYNASKFHTYRIIMRGTGSPNAWLYIDGVLVVSEQFNSAVGVSGMLITCDSTNGVGTATYYIEYLKNFCRPLHPTRRKGMCYIAYMDQTAESSTRYVTSGVTLNDLDDLLDTPKLGTLAVLEKDLSWGDTGFEATGNLEYRGSNTVFTTTTTPGTLAYTAVTVPSNNLKRDPFSRFAFDYFQVRIPVTKQTQEITFFRYCRQLDVTDYVSSWGSSTFEKDFLSRKINAGDLRITLLNSDADFDTLRTRPDVWTDAIWETWIGANTDFGDFQYPDFIGTIDNLVFESNPPQVTLEITNCIKKFRETKIGSLYAFPPFYEQKVYSGGTCYRMPVRNDTVNNKLYLLDSKHDLQAVVSTDVVVYVDNVVQASGYTFTTTKPGKILFTTAPSGTVTVDIKPNHPFLQDNGGTLLREILQMEGRLHLNLDLDNSTLTTLETDIEDVSVNNLVVSEMTAFDLMEKVCIQTGSILFINAETQDSIGFALVDDLRLESETITDRSLDSSFHLCDTITINNPIENVITNIEFTYDSENHKQKFSYENSRLVSDYDIDSPIATKSIASVFGNKKPSKRITENTNTFFNLVTDYDLLVSEEDVAAVADRNFALFGFRPPIYELNGVPPNIFIYSMRDILYIMRDSATDVDDTIEITRIEKDYDNLTGSIQGFSNKLYQFPGGVTLVPPAFAAPDTVCTNSPTIDPCVITGRTINGDSALSTSVWVAVDTFGDTEESFAQ